MRASASLFEQPSSTNEPHNSGAEQKHPEKQRQEQGSPWFVFLATGPGVLEQEHLEQTPAGPYHAAEP